MIGKEPFVVVRQFQPGDEGQCSRLLYDGVMATVRQSFITALTREITFQIIITMAAVMFVFIGLSPTICISAIPATIVFIYVWVYASHVKSASRYQEDAFDIQREYMSSKFTCFWVAEVYEPYGKVTHSSQLKYKILGESELDSQVKCDGGYSKKVVGTIGVNRCDVMYESAWIKRLAVGYRYQRKGIATALLNTAIQFCQDKGYESIELVTSEYHDPARKLFLQKGFKLRQLYHKPSSGVNIQMYQFTLAIPSNSTEKKTD